MAILDGIEQKVTMAIIIPNMKILNPSITIIHIFEWAIQIFLVDAEQLSSTEKYYFLVELCTWFKKLTVIMLACEGIPIISTAVDDTCTTKEQ